MKKRVYTIEGKRLVEGDPNLVTKDEILVEKTEDNTYSLKDYNGNVLTGGNGGDARGFFQQALYYTRNSDNTILCPIEGSSNMDADEMRVYSVPITMAYSEVTGGKTSYKLGSYLKLDNHAYGGDYGTRNFFENLVNFLNRGYYSGGPRPYVSDLLIKYANLTPTSIPGNYYKVDSLVKQAYTNKYGEGVGDRFSKCTTDSLFINFAMNLPERYIATVSDSALTEKELMDTVRKTMKAYSNVCAFSPSDSPILGVLYTYEQNATNGNFTHGVYFIVSYLESYLESDSSHKILGYTAIDTLNSARITDSSYKEISDSADKNAVYEKLCKIPESKFSVSGNSDSTNYQYTYVIYNVAADKFYPILHHKDKK